MRTRTAAWTLVATASLGVVTWSLLRRFGEPELATVLATSRPLEGRLAGLDHAPFHGPLVLGPAGRRQLADAARHRERRRAQLSLEELAERALVELLTDRTAEAVVSLREAIERAPNDPRWHSDLAAAYLARGEQSGDHLDFLRAYEAVQAALERDPRHLPGRFNRALALERFGFREQARQAWREYCQRDRGSRWGLEARRRWRALAAAGDRSRVGSALLAGAREGGDAALAVHIGEAAEAVRDTVLDELLPRWADARRAGDDAAAEQTLAAAHRLGRALEQQTGDALVADAIALLQRADEIDDGERLALLSAAHQAFRAGRRAYLGPHPERAEPLLHEARRLFAAAGSPVEHWATAWLLGVDFLRHDYERILSRVAQVQERADEQRYPSLFGRLHWAAGLAQARRGALAEALPRLRAAARCFARPGERESRGAIQVVLAENLTFLGQESEAWNHRARAFADLEAASGPLHLHNFLGDLGNAAWAAGLPETSRLAHAEDVRRARESGDAGLLAEALLWSARDHLHAGRPGPALNDLRRAREALAAVAARDLQARTAADLAVVEAEARLAREPAAAAAALRQALDYYLTNELHYDLASIDLLRARAALATDDPVEAEAALEAAVGRFGRARIEGLPETEQITYFERAQPFFDEMMEFQVQRRRRPQAALVYAERARSLLTAPVAAEPGWRDADAFVAALAHRMPPKVALVEYALTGEKLFVWTISRQGLRFHGVEVERRRLEEDSRALATRLRRGAPRGAWEPLARDLFDRLVAPVVATLPPETALVLVPEGALSELPFAVLIDPATGRLLVEDRALGLAPSAGSFLRAWERAGTVEPRSSWDALIVADPAADPELLPEHVRRRSLGAVGEESRAVTGSFPASRVLAGAAATPGRVLAGLGSAQVFHYAGHAVDNPRRPASSLLLLAPEGEGGSGALYAHQLAGRTFDRLRLVVLSACSTAGASSSRVAALSGLARPFLDGGAAAVVATLWEVEDQAAGELVAAFYHHLARGADALSALQAAQLEMLHHPDPDRRPPATWAAFQVLGQLPAEPVQP